MPSDFACKFMAIEEILGYLWCQMGAHRKITHDLTRKRHFCNVWLACGHSDIALAFDLMEFFQKVID